MEATLISLNYFYPPDRIAVDIWAGDIFVDSFNL